MAFSQSIDKLELLTVMSNSRARIGIMASPTSFKISPETLIYATALFLHIAAKLLLMILVLMENG
jgi:hypothetical protein